MIFLQGASTQPCNFVGQSLTQPSNYIFPVFKPLHNGLSLNIHRTYRCYTNKQNRANVMGFSSSRLSYKETDVHLDSPTGKAQKAEGVLRLTGSKELRPWA